ncbi:phosphate ABC transporter substrate-binding protein PstS [Cryobacterium sp. TMT1-21]|uniref:Phosphate-binding protein n=1 Tax=Cryobacterium shii TaxID=1259235 RepID=A0AAQ2HER6_9MICO|nr:MULTISPECIES: phosphate ABC transporter substrate-binding protein PstS [Cryobacterium]TFC42794.1 phosphate ABC transporter substrate-binding protein PstS [Cryobacterium shii]TFC89003.1 phosphate ABC transporter substrate-binding protein PstS [Cryobacterium sp. TmT2-59]TFD11593.1 phosphate ABC transporter substrate-binding protein PstS [Cryobacterium sp. TMT4-10]TFD14729.1 phosphate ABC transporter substrate-binding protein PstS [Cryobacterium sp. TMT1-21]TFD22316.1 phosphate ABC transporter
MNFTRFGRPAVIAVVAALALSSCASNESATPASTEGAASALTGTLTGAGSSAQGSAQEAWIAAFQTANPDVTVNYDPSGSGAGRETFIGGGSDFAGSDSYLKDEELAGTFAACAPGSSAVDLPVYISPIAVIFNVEGVKDLNLDSDTLAKIFKGEITTWNDPAIAALNPKATLPATAITAVHRSDDSGTTKNFTDYLFQTAPDVWTDAPADPFPLQSGEGAKGTSGVVDAVTNGVGTIGYADASKAGDLGVAKIKVGDKFVGYTADAAAAVVADSPLVEGRDKSDLAIKINRLTTDPTHYPLVLVSYAVVCTEYADAAQGELVKAYVSYMAGSDGQSVAASAGGAAPLSTELADKVSAVLATIK